MAKLLKARRFGDFRSSTLSWWRSIRKALHRNNPMTAHLISLSPPPTA